jgi:hypothetical protein
MPYKQLRHLHTLHAFQASHCVHRWGTQEGEVQEVDIAIVGLAVTLHAAEVPPAASLLLAPQDWDLHLEQNAAAASTAVLLRGGALTACASPAAVQALGGLHAALMPSDGSKQTDAEASGESAPPAAAPQQTDDLSCGLFSLSPEVAGRPGSLLVSLCITSGRNSRPSNPSLWQSCSLRKSNR